ncbi:hypothetical protein ACLVWU_05600 [Bdellovibrio sp. HCB290]|uniref:hypothetical protein n=1 Tax=Bdellovibrio sp. HCB290 TaxID=3394356 RepID=UPI0039B50B50
MTLAKIAFCVAVVGLAACSDKSNSNNPISPEYKVKDYSQSATLNLLQTNDDLGNAKSNAVSIKGTGRSSTYKITYHFNTANNSSFKIVNTRQTLYAVCDRSQSEVQIEMTLKGQNTDRKVTVLDQVDVAQNSDYTLEVVATPQCESLDLNFDITAWVGNPLTDAKVAYICDSKSIGQMTLVEGVNFVTAYSSVSGKRKFLDYESFCGEAFRGSKGSCDSKMNLERPTPEFGYAELRCEATKDLEKRSSKAEFNVNSGTASVSCAANGIVTFAETFTSCRSRLIDYKQLTQVR